MGLRGKTPFGLFRGTCLSRMSRSPTARAFSLLRILEYLPRALSYMKLFAYGYLLITFTTPPSTVALFDGPYIATECRIVEVSGGYSRTSRSRMSSVSPSRRRALASVPLRASDQRPLPAFRQHLCVSIADDGRNLLHPATAKHRTEEVRTKYGVVLRICLFPYRYNAKVYPNRSILPYWMRVEERVGEKLLESPRRMRLVNRSARDLTKEEIDSYPRKCSFWT